MQSIPCAICGEVHWPICRKVANNTQPSVDPVANKPSRASKYRDPEKRRAYMRDLMRKRRAASKTDGSR